MRSSIMSKTLMTVAALMGYSNPHGEAFHKSKGSSYGGKTSKRPHDKKKAEHYRDLRLARKIYNSRRRLPRNHPNKICGPVETIK